MVVRLIKENEIDTVMNIIDEAKVYFKEQGSSQWQNGYPNHEAIYNDYIKKQGYVLEDNNQIIGYAALVLEEDPNYKVIDGKWLYDGDYGVIHRVCLRNINKGKGYAHMFFMKLEELCREHQLKSMRIDTHALNKSMLRTIEKEQFKYCGIVIVGDGTERYACEKMISE